MPYETTPPAPSQHVQPDIAAKCKQNVIAAQCSCAHCSTKRSLAPVPRSANNYTTPNEHTAAQPESQRACPFCHFSGPRLPPPPPLNGCAHLAGRLPRCGTLPVRGMRTAAHRPSPGTTRDSLFFCKFWRVQTERGSACAPGWRERRRRSARAGSVRRKGRPDADCFSRRRESLDRSRYT
jgi:hypothetical protein